MQQHDVGVAHNPQRLHLPEQCCWQGACRPIGAVIITAEAVTAVLPHTLQRDDAVGSLVPGLHHLSLQTMP